MSPTIRTGAEYRVEEEELGGWLRNQKWVLAQRAQCLGSRNLTLGLMLSHLSPSRLRGAESIRWGSQGRGSWVVLQEVLSANLSPFMHCPCTMPPPPPSFPVCHVGSTGSLLH